MKSFDFNSLTNYVTTKNFKNNVSVNPTGRVNSNMYLWKTL